MLRETSPTDLCLPGLPESITWDRNGYELDFLGPGELPEGPVGIGFCRTHMSLPGFHSWKGAALWKAFIQDKLWVSIWVLGSPGRCARSPQRPERDEETLGCSRPKCQGKWCVQGHDVCLYICLYACTCVCVSVFVYIVPIGVCLWLHGYMLI